MAVVVAVVGVVTMRVGGEGLLRIDRGRIGSCWSWGWGC
jgi:hypothetical protein